MTVVRRLAYATVRIFIAMHLLTAVEEDFVEICKTPQNVLWKNCATRRITMQIAAHWGQLDVGNSLKNMTQVNWQIWKINKNTCKNMGRKKYEMPHSEHF